MGYIKVFHSQRRMGITKTAASDERRVIARDKVRVLVVRTGKTQ